MRTRVVSSSELSTKSLSASDYVGGKVRWKPPPEPGTPTGYERSIIQAFVDVCAINKKKSIEGASPAEVTARLAKRGELAALDTVIDIADLMKGLRDRRLL